MNAFPVAFFFSEQRSRIVTIFEYWSNISKSGKGCSFMISVILSFLFVLTWDLLEDGHIDDIAIISNKILLFLSYKTNRFHVVMGLYRSHQNIVKNISDTRLHLVCHFFVLTTFWHYLWSFTEQTCINTSELRHQHDISDIVFPDCHPLSNTL